MFDAPNPIEDARLESRLNLFGYLEAELGNPFLRSLRFKAFEERIGAGFKGNFAPPLAQVLDAAYAADYALSVKGEAKLGTGIDDIVRLLGLGSLTSIDLDIERELARSPKALKVEADRATFAAGDTINAKVTLDPATLNFLGVYNVDSVQLRRRVGSVTEVLATLNASTGQQVFDLSVTAPNNGNVSEWMAFVTTWALPFELASLELGPVQSGTGIVVIRDFSNTRGGCEASAHSWTTRFPEIIRDETLPATCNAAHASARASVTVAPVVTGPSLVIGEEVRTNALAFSFFIEVNPEQQGAQPLQDRAWAYGHAVASRELRFRVGTETRMGVSFDYATTGGGRLYSANGVAVRDAYGAVREAIRAGEGREVVLHPGDTVDLLVGVEAFARAESEPNRFPEDPRSARAQANVVFRFNP